MTEAGERRWRLPLGWRLGPVALIVVAAAVGGWSSAHAATAHRSASTAPHASGTQAAPEPDVRTIFLSDCAVCHGGDGRGTDKAPTLVGVGRASLDYELSTGRMPLFPVGRTDQPGTPLQPLPRRFTPDADASVTRHEPAYPPATIAALVDYVDALTGGGGPDIPVLAGGDLAEGGKAFRLQCAACHAWAGDGGALLRREAPPLHDATPVQIGEAVRLGPGEMPAFGQAALTDQQLASVAAYVRYLDHPKNRGGLALGHLGPVSEGAAAFAALAVLLVFIAWAGERG